MQYLAQQDFNNTVKFDNTLLKLHEEVKRLQEAFFKQVSIENFL